MFIASVSAFIAGIYIEAGRPFPFTCVLIPFIIIVAAIPLLLKKKNNGFACALLIAAFFFAGMFRMWIVPVPRHQSLSPASEEATIYRGLVVESSKNTKVVRLDDPSHVSGVRAIVRTDQPLCIGDRLTLFGSLRELSVTFKNPHSISWRWLKRLEGTFCEIRGKIVSVTPDSRLIDTWRRYLSNRIEVSGATNSEILKALTIGDTTGLNETTRTLFLETGTSHILSISGSHLGILTAFFFFLARFLFRRSSRMRQSGDDQRYAAILTIPFAVLFMFTAGSGIPTVRATIMITACMVAIFFEHGRHTGNILFLSALIILVIYPHSLFSPSFQLTFISVLFIIPAVRLFHPHIREWHLLIRWPLSLILVTLAATIGTLPVVIYHFQGFNPISILHNMIAVPLMCLISTPLALAGLFVPFGDSLLRLTGEIIGVAITVLQNLNRGYIYPVVRPDLTETLLYLSILLSLLFINKKLVRLTLFAFILPIALVTTSIALHKRFYNNDLCVNYLDVGLGDAILVEAPYGIRLLIDGGGFYMSDFDTGKSVIAPYLLSKKIRTLDYVLNTHPHEDHLGGLRHILRHFRVNGFVTASITGSEPQYIRLSSTLKARNIPDIHLARGESLMISRGLSLDVLHPPAGILTNDLNDTSLVLKIAFGQKSFLFTGDIGEGVENALILSGSSLKSSVLKIPHHGSRNSSSINFLRAVDPSIAVLTVGPGIRGIPSDESLKRYRALSVPVYRTDLDGCISVCTDGNKLTIKR